MDLLRIAGELAERKGSTSVSVEHIDHAKEKIEKERTIGERIEIEEEPREPRIRTYEPPNASLRDVLDRLKEL